MMYNQLLLINIISLSLAAVFGCIAVIRIYKRIHRILTFRILLIVNTVLIGPLSGIAHLVQFKGAARGYYDVTVSPGMGVATVGTVLATVVVSLASARKSKRETVEPKQRVPDLDTRDEAILIAGAIVLLPISLYALDKVSSYAADSGLVRLISVDQGFARYSFTSNWFVWAVTFGAIAVVMRIWRHAPIFAALVVIGAVAAIIGSLSWSGGRSIILVMVLPLLVVVGPHLKKLNWLLGACVLPLLGYIVLTLSSARSNHSSTSAYLSAPTWFDWQWGRYSLLGFASNYATHHGFLDGQTFAASVLHFLEGFPKLFGLPVPSDGLHQVTDYTGSQLAGSVDAIYIVPGLTAELYMNFGLVGIAVGMYALARLTDWADRRFDGAQTIVTKLTWAYFGTLLVFRTLTSSSDAIFSYLAYVGLPLLITSSVSLIARKRALNRGSVVSPLDRKLSVLTPISGRDRPISLESPPIGLRSQSNKPMSNGVQHAETH